MVNEKKQDTYEHLDFFFEDAIMLRRFMEYFDTFTLEIDYGLYKKNTAERMILEGVPDTEIAKKIDLKYTTVWKIKDRLLKRGLLKHYEKGSK